MNTNKLCKVVLAVTLMVLLAVPNMLLAGDVDCYAIVTWDPNVPNIWMKIPLISSDVNYNSITSTAGFANEFGTNLRYFAAPTDGGIHWIDPISTGSWGAFQLFPSSAGSFTALTGHKSAENNFLAARTDGGVDLFSVGGSGWEQVNVLSNGVVYNSIATDMSLDDVYYGARADGGVDIIQKSEDEWAVSSLFDSSIGVITSIAANKSKNQHLMLTRADGGIDFAAVIDWDSGYLVSWYYFNLISNGVVYNSVTNSTGYVDATGASLRYFGARADGGLDVIGVYDGSWQALPWYDSSTGTYGSLTANYTTSDYFFATTAVPGSEPVPEPGSIIPLAIGGIGLLGAIRRRR